MMQQINLYQVEEPVEATIVTFKHMLQVVAIFTGVLLFITSYKFVAYYNVQREFAVLKKQQDTLGVQLEQVQGKIPAKAEKEQLIQQIEELEITAVQMKQIQLVLTQLQDVNKYKFSAYLEALSKCNIPDLWLTSLKITSGGSLVHLKGKTTVAENVPKLLQKLGTQPAFAGKSFKTFKLYTTTDKKIVQFTMGSTNE